MATLVEGGPESPHTDKLYIFPWQVYPDMMVFDWFIRLADKDRSDHGGDHGHGVWWRLRFMRLR